MALRVLQLITDLEIGGTPTVVRELAVRLGALPAFDVQVACLSPRGPVADEIERAGRRVTALNARGVWDVGVVWRLARLVREQHIDVVFSFLMHANAVAAVAKVLCPAVRLIESVQTTQPWPAWHWPVQGIASEAAERVVVPSVSAGTAAVEWAGVPREKIVVIPNAVDWQAFTSVPPVLAEPTRIGFIGRLDPVKRVPDLVEAMARLPAYLTLQIFGEGPDRPRIEAAIGRFAVGDRVSLRGRVADPRQGLSQMDVLVLPSQAEGFGLVLIEAMAAGRVVVASDVPGIRDVVKDGMTGLLAPAGNPAALAQAIGLVLSDRALREQLVARAGVRVRDLFSWERVLAMYAQVLRGESGRH